MKERPILFSGPMVKALLAGTKTQTRRLVKRPKAATLYGRHDVPERHFADPGFGDGIYLHWFYGGGDLGDDTCSTRVWCPYGKPSDRLWVRETWGFDSGVRADFRPLLGRRDLSGMDLLEHTVYRADVPAEHEAEEHSVRRKHGGAPWRPGIHMPRWASRITLEVTEVRAQRLQDISEEDAKAEGISGVPFYPDDGFPLSTGYMVGADDGKTPLETTAKGALQKLWDAINGERAPWSSNPWVWAITFRRLP